MKTPDRFYSAKGEPFPEDRVQRELRHELRQLKPWPAHVRSADGPTERPCYARISPEDSRRSLTGCSAAIAIQSIFAGR